MAEQLTIETAPNSQVVEDIHRLIRKFLLDKKKRKEDLRDLVKAASEAFEVLPQNYRILIFRKYVILNGMPSENEDLIYTRYAGLVPLVTSSGDHEPSIFAFKQNTASKERSLILRILSNQLEAVAIPLEEAAEIIETMGVDGIEPSTTAL